LNFARQRLRREGASNAEWMETGLQAALFADARGMIADLLGDPQLVVAGADKRPGRSAGDLHIDQAE